MYYCSWLESVVADWSVTEHSNDWPEHKQIHGVFPDHGIPHTTMVQNFAIRSIICQMVVSFSMFVLSPHLY